MGAALSVFALLSVSVFVTRVAAVALRLTGLAEESARFQALSAFTGTGFTTSEAEAVVNYPVRRRIVIVLMIIGNLGLVTIFATLVVSLVNTEGDPGAVLSQVAWFLVGLALLWFFMLNGVTDRLMCRMIGGFLESTTLLGGRRFHRLLQIGSGFSLCEHPITRHWRDRNASLTLADLQSLGLTLLAVRTARGSILAASFCLRDGEEGDALVLFGLDTGHEVLERGFRPESRSSGCAGTPPEPSGDEISGPCYSEPRKPL